MRVVVDTNVILSALLFGGQPQKVLDLIRLFEIELYLSPFILDEIDKILFRKFHWPKRERRRLNVLLSSQAIIVHPTYLPSVIKACPADNHILACAWEAKVDVLVSGDKKHILPLKVWEGMRVMSPSDFLEFLVG